MGESAKGSRRLSCQVTFQRSTSCHEIHVQLPSLKLGIVEATVVQLTDLNPRLSEEIDIACDRLRRQYCCFDLSNCESIVAVRKLFRDWGVDPCKYRPSSESLLRRLLKGRTFPRISNIVDAGNLSALETGWPYGCYDSARISGPIEIRHGKPGEQYCGIGRELLRLDSRPVFSDIRGPFGSPISDSCRTMVTESTRDVLVLICAPQSSCKSVLQRAISRLVGRLTYCCGAQVFRQSILDPVEDHVL